MREKGPKRDPVGVSTTTRNAYPCSCHSRKNSSMKKLVTKMYKLNNDLISPTCPVEGKLYIH